MGNTVSPFPRPSWVSRTTATARLGNSPATAPRQAAPAPRAELPQLGSARLGIALPTGWLSASPWRRDFGVGWVTSLPFLELALRWMGAVN